MFNFQSCIGNQSDFVSVKHLAMQKFMETMQTSKLHDTEIYITYSATVGNQPKIGTAVIPMSVTGVIDGIGEITN